MPSSRAEAWERVYPGWTATERGYWYSDAEARDLLRALRTNNREVEHWYRVYREIADAALENSATVTSQTEKLKAFLAEERETTDRTIQKAVKVGGGWGFGVFAGVGYTGAGDVQAVFGGGLVYKF